MNRTILNFLYSARTMFQRNFLHCYNLRGPLELTILTNCIDTYIVN